MEPARHDEAVALRVVVVDDEALFRNSLSFLLESSQGLTVVGTAHSGAAAISAATSADADVVVMDIRMPGMDGIEAIRRLLAARPQTRVIAVSAADDDNEEARAIEAGAALFLRKDRMTETIEDAIRGGKPAPFRVRSDP